MQKLIRIKLFYLVLGVTIALGITSAFAYSIIAQNVGFTSLNTTWEADNVKTALDDLYTKLGETLLWTNPNPTAAFGAQTISLDLSSYESVLIETLSCFGGDLNDGRPNAINFVSVGHSSGLADSGSNDMRSISVTTSSITFGNARYGQWDDNGCVIPYKIYGSKMKSLSKD